MENQLPFTTNINIINRSNRCRNRYGKKITTTVTDHSQQNNNGNHFDKNHKGKEWKLPLRNCSCMVSSDYVVFLFSPLVCLVLCCVAASVDLRHNFMLRCAEVVAVMVSLVILIAVLNLIVITELLQNHGCWRAMLHAVHCCCCLKPWWWWTWCLMK